MISTLLELKFYLRERQLKEMNREKKEGRKESGGKGQREDRQEEERRKERRKLSQNVINTIEERKVENKDSWKYYICLWFCGIKWVYVWGAGKALLKS